VICVVVMIVAGVAVFALRIATLRYQTR